MDKHIYRIALAGNPNCGKTTIFNQLTGTRQHVGNYPGVTVERKSGMCRINDFQIEIIDLPGIYSLSNSSPEEKVAFQELLNGGIDLILNVVDSGNAQRNLYLTTQLAELDLPMLLVFNMIDDAKQRGLHFDFEKLSGFFGAPIVKTVGSTGFGMKELRDEVYRIAHEATPQRPVKPKYGPKTDQAIRALTDEVAKVQRPETRLGSGPLFRDQAAGKRSGNLCAAGIRVAAGVGRGVARGDYHPERDQQPHADGGLPLRRDRRSLPGGDFDQQRTPPPALRHHRQICDEPVSRRADFPGDDVSGLHVHLYGRPVSDGLAGNAVRRARQRDQFDLAGGTGGVSAGAAGGWHHRRRRRRAGVSAEHPAALHRNRVSGGDRLYGAGGFRDGRLHAHVRAARQKLYSDAARFRLLGPGGDGDPHHRIRTRPADHDYGDPLHELRGAAPDLRFDHPCLFRAEIPGAGDVADVRDRRGGGARRRAAVEIHDFQRGRGGVRNGAAALPGCRRCAAS